MGEQPAVKKLLKIIEIVGATAFLEHAARAMQVLGDDAEMPDKFYQLSSKLDKLADESN